MSSTSINQRFTPTGSVAPSQRLLGWLLIIVILAMLPGCGGCLRNAKKLSEKEQEAERQRKKKEEKAKPKPDFEFRRLNTLPSPRENVERTIKPGHWTAASLEAWAHNFDYRGQVAMEPMDLDQMPFKLGTVRSATLPKAQRRDIELLLFAPAGLNPRNLPIALQTPAGRPLYREAFFVSRMAAHQFYLLTLARTPENYGYLREIDSVRASTGALQAPEIDPHYRALAPTWKSRLPLSANSLTWTNLAYLIWDDLDPQQFSPDQQQALLDWLHWGGQMIISGPSSMAQLKASFLTPYLPAESLGTIELRQADLANLSRQWSPPGIELAVSKPWAAEQLQASDKAQVVLTAKSTPLVADRRVGRGRITITAFSLAQRELTEWPGFDNFFNGCLLRRPARRFAWEEEAVAFHWADGTNPHDPRRTSQLRYFTRDAGLQRSWHQHGQDASGPVESQNSFDDIDGLDIRHGPGVAGWDDFGQVSNAAREALREAAGIKIPEPSFVVWTLAAYLIVLVPLNWAFFRLLGRVELAWLAAPVISLAGALLVVRAAQLDIGFVRASNELAVIEIQPDYPRAHVTRYTALYTSLSTGYKVEFDDPSALAQPFPDGSGLLRGQNRGVVMLRTDGKIGLNGFRVSSNALGLVHSEHMLPGVGGFELTQTTQDRWQITNKSPWRLSAARIVHGRQAAHLGEFNPGETKQFFFPTNDDSSDADSRAGALVPASDPGIAKVNSLTEIAQADTDLNEWRLLGSTAEKLPGITITPASSQSRQVNLVVAHLRYDPGSDCASDEMTRHEVEQKWGVAVQRRTATE